MTGRSNIAFIVCLCLLAHVSPAQEYTIRSALEAVPASGFYKIPVVPELTAYARPDLADLRILDTLERQVPYIIRQSRPATQNEIFYEFPVLEKRSTDSQTVVEILSPLPKAINELSLVIGNTAVERFTSLSGSEDRQ